MPNQINRKHKSCWRKWANSPRTWPPLSTTPLKTGGSTYTRNSLPADRRKPANPCHSRPPGGRNRRVCTDRTRDELHVSNQEASRPFRNPLFVHFGEQGGRQVALAGVGKDGDDGLARVLGARGQDGSCGQRGSRAYCAAKRSGLGEGRYEVRGYGHQETGRKQP